MKQELINTKTEQTTDDWPIGKLLKHIVLPKPDGSPKRGRKERWLRILIAGAVATVAVVAASSFYDASTEVPACDAKDVVGAARGFAEQVLTAPTRDDPTIRFGNIKEVSYDRLTETRVCQAALVLKSGKREAAYTVQWVDKDKKQYQVNVRIVSAMN